MAVNNICDNRVQKSFSNLMGTHVFHNDTIDKLDKMFLEARAHSNTYMYVYGKTKYSKSTMTKLFEFE